VTGGAARQHNEHARVNSQPLTCMVYRLGRLMQLAGMLILPQAIVLELLGKVSLGQSLLIAVAGAGVFIVGVSVQRSSGR
jgi:hypothetical protein